LSRDAPADQRRTERLVRRGFRGADFVLYVAPMRKHLGVARSLVLCLGLGLAVGCQGQGSSKPVEPKTEEQKTFYALGLLLGRNIQTFKLTAGELELVKQGMTDSVTGKKPLVELQVYGPKVNEMARGRASAHAAADQAENEAKAKGEKDKGKAYAEQAAKEEGAVKTASGLVMKTLKPGTGESPKATDKVRVHYHGTLIDGTVFDSSVQRGQPAEFPLNGVIPCWTEGVQKMKVGEKARLVCPSSIAYGDAGRPSIPPGATLIFEVELLAVVK
jgi:FKBP-type peptidyl-prolyl cis-trans isomerase FkpA